MGRAAGATGALYQADSFSKTCIPVLSLGQHSITATCLTVQFGWHLGFLPEPRQGAAACGNECSKQSVAHLSTAPDSLCRKAEKQGQV